MRWSDVRAAYPEQWLIIEALEAHTEGDRRILDRIAVMELCSDGSNALKAYRRLHREYPMREFYFVCTSREEVEIVERWWTGIRRDYATHPPR